MNSSRTMVYAGKEETPWKARRGSEYIFDPCFLARQAPFRSLLL